MRFNLENFFNVDNATENTDSDYLETEHSEHTEGDHSDHTETDHTETEHSEGDHSDHTETEHSEGNHTESNHPEGDHHDSDKEHINKLDNYILSEGKSVRFKRRENFFHNKKMMIWFAFLAIVIIFLIFGRSDNVIVVKS